MPSIEFAGTLYKYTYFIIIFINIEGPIKAVCAKSLQIVLKSLHLGRYEVLRSLRHYLRAQCQGHHSPSIAWRRGVQEEALNDRHWEDEKGPSDQHWNCFKGNIGETPERRGGAHIMGLPEQIDIILNWTEHSFFPSAIRLWTSLPSDSPTAQSLPAFRSSMKNRRPIPTSPKQYNVSLWASCMNPPPPLPLFITHAMCTPTTVEFFLNYRGSHWPWRR